MAKVFQVMLPVLKLLESGEEIRVLDLNGLMNQRSDDLGWERSPINSKMIISAVRLMRKAGLVDKVSKGFVRITDAGRSALESNPSRIDERFLKRYPEYRTYVARVSNRKKRAKSPVMPEPQMTRVMPASSIVPTVWGPALPDTNVEEPRTPETPASVTIVKGPYEKKLSKPLSQRRRKAAKRKLSGQARIHEDALRTTIQQLNGELESRLVEHISVLRPAAVLNLATDLFAAMGFGGPDAAVAPFDLADLKGAVLKDALNITRLFVMVAHAKEVTVDDMARFKLGLEAARASAGVLVAAAGISNMAQGFASGIAKRTAIIDFEELAYLMVRTGVGMSEDTNYAIRRIDEHFFTGGSA